MGRDNSAVAEAIVVHGEMLCERENHLWDVISNLSIPTELLTDTRQQHKTAFDTDTLVRAFLYAEIRGFSQNELAQRLQQRPSLLHAFGFDLSERRDAPRQQTLSHAWNAFSDNTQRVIETAAVGIANYAVDYDVIGEGLVPILADDDAETSDEDDNTHRERVQQQATKTIKLARKHAFPEFESGRSLNRTYDDDEILDMVARTCSHAGSAHSEGEYGWLSDDEHTAHGSTILRVLKQFATPEGEDGQLTLDEILAADGMPKIDSIRDALMDSFDSAVENIISSIKGGGPFADRHKTAAIDITHEQFHVWPWKDKDAGIPKRDFPRMVSGYKKDNAYKRGYKYATLTLAGELVPIILGVEPVKENSTWEEEDAPSYSKAELVDRLLEKAERFVDLDEVYLDRGFHSKEVYAVIEDWEITYTAPAPVYQPDYSAIKKIEEHSTADAAVNHDVPVAVDGEVHHHTEYLYVPSRNDDADGQYAVFVTNRDRVEPDEIQAVCNGYRRRWDIENQYKSIKECLPRTSSTDYRVRLCNFVLAGLLYNLWRLTDYLIKVGRDVAIRSPPEVGFKSFLRALGEFLHRVD
jgi:hypothetical protein